MKLSIDTIVVLILILLSNRATSQEFMHWKFLEGEKTDRIKTMRVWQYPTSDSSGIQEKTLFSYHEFDIQDRIIALKMYSEDTSYYEYDSLGVQRTTRSGDDIKIDPKTISKYSNTGKIVYEFQGGEYGHEYVYLYDSLDRKVKMIVSPSLNEIFHQDTLFNITIYNRKGNDSIRRHFEGNILKIETFYRYDDRQNCIMTISCNYSDTPTCDTTRTEYNELNQKISRTQQWHKYNDSEVQVSMRKWEYDRKGRMITAEDNVSICRWKYTMRGYVKEAKRYNKQNDLRFFVKYEYTFWKKKEYRNRKK